MFRRRRPSKKSSSKPQNQDADSSKQVSGSSKGSGKAPQGELQTADEETSEEETPVVSFIAKIAELNAPFAIRHPEVNSNNMWDPPKTSRELGTSNSLFFHWNQGFVKRLSRDKLPPIERLDTHNVASVFVQIETRHLLFTDINAAAKDVKDHRNGKWSRLFFKHKRLDPESREYYTSLVFDVAEKTTAARMSDHCVPQLIPDVYNNASSTKENAGVIGKLPLLIALAAFSARKQDLIDVLTKSMAPGEWLPHRHESGRLEEYRGIVVTIYYDPGNREGSNEASLTALEDGDMGAFYN